MHIKTLRNSKQNVSIIVYMKIILITPFGYRKQRANVHVYAQNALAKTSTHGKKRVN